MTDPYRIRVQRLLSGEFSPNDITCLFLYVRDRCDGREAVREVGDFVAHQAEREKGIVTNTVRDWFVISRFQITLALNGSKLDPFRIPSTFPNFLNATARRLTDNELRKHNIQKKKLSERINAITEKLLPLDNDTLSWSISHTDDDIKLMSIMIKYLAVTPAFTDDRLFDDLSKTLLRLGILNQNERRLFERQKSIISLYAVTCMHRTSIKLDKDEIVRLIAKKRDDCIEVHALIPFPEVEGRSTRSRFITSNMFRANVDVVQYCERELIESESPWNFSLEITNNRRLGRLS